MAKQDSVVVQFVYLLPRPQTSDFRLRPINSEKFSAGFKNIFAVVKHTELSLAEYVIPSGPVQHQWNNFKIPPVQTVCRKCFLVQAVVWEPKTQMRIESDHAWPAASFEPLDADETENCFWVVDLEAKRLISAGANFKAACAEFDSIVAEFSNQLDS